MTVSRILNTETGLPRTRAGRPHKLSDHAKRKVIRDISSGKIENTVIAAHELSEVTRQTVHPENVRRVLRKAGLKSIKKKKKPFLSKKHRKQRLDFAQKYANWTVEDFKRVIWSDPSKPAKILSQACRAEFKPFLKQKVDTQNIETYYSIICYNCSHFSLFLFLCIVVTKL